MVAAVSGAGSEASGRPEGWAGAADESEVGGGFWIVASAGPAHEPTATTTPPLRLGADAASHTKAATWRRFAATSRCLPSRTSAGACPSPLAYAQAAAPPQASPDLEVGRRLTASADQRGKRSPQIGLSPANHPGERAD